MRRPSFLFLAAVWAGICCGRIVGLGPAPLSGVLAVLGMGAGLVRGSGARLTLVVTAFCVLGILRSPESRWRQPVVPAELAGVSGLPVVLSVETAFLAPDCSETATALVSQVIAGPAALEGRSVLLRGLGSLDPPGCTRFSVCGKFAAPRRRLNPFGPDPTRRYRRLGVVGAVDVTAVRASPTWPAAGISAFRERLEDLTRTAYPGESSGMLEAMLLGQRSLLAPRVETVMLRAGTYHVISVSGMHVAIVLFIISAFLSVLGLPRGVLTAVYSAATVFYVVFTGTPPSAVRSGGLFLAAGLVRALQWKVDAANCVCATGTILLLAMPHFAWDIGFQLSLAAVLGMVLLVASTDPRWPAGSGPWKMLGRHLVSGLVVCLAAQAFTLPLILRDFGRVSVVAPLGNLIMVPLTTLALAGGMEAAVALIFSEPLAAVFMKAATAMTHLSLVGTAWLARLPWALVYSGRPSLMRLIPYCAGLAYLSFFSPRDAKRANLLLLVVFHVLLAIPAPQQGRDLLRATFLYVGDGDAAVLGMPGGQTILVDAGPDTEGQGWSQSPVVSFLAIEGINRIDQVVVTHSHADHYGGLASLIDNIAIGEILVGRLDGEPEYVMMLSRARAKGIRVRTIKAGDRWQSGRASVTVLHPQEADPGPGADPNSESVVLRVELGEFALLLTGDVTPEVGRDLAWGDAGAAHADAIDPGVPERSLACTVLKAPHHGAPNSLDRDFLARCGASIAVVSAGSKWASHPSPATIEMLKASGALTLVTSTDGAVSLVTDGNVVDLKTQSGIDLTLAARRAPD